MEILYIKQKAFSFGDKYKVFDEKGNVKFFVSSKIFSIHHVKYIYDADNNFVMTIFRKCSGIIPQYFVYDENDEIMETIIVKFSVNKDFDVEANKVNNYSVRGDFYGLNLQFYNGEEEVVSLSKKLFQFVDSYEIKIYNLSYTKYIVGFVIAFDNCVHNRKS